MTRRMMALAVFSLTLPLLAAEPDEGVRRIDVAVCAKAARLTTRWPSVIKSVDELAEVIHDSTTRGTVAARVDFGSEKLLVFMWAGPEDDKLTFAVGPKGKCPKEGGREVVFTRARGKGGDHFHVRLFAMPKDGMTWSVRKTK